MKFHSIVRKDALILGMAAVGCARMMKEEILYETGLTRKIKNFEKE